jgi:hypothetical protein
MVYIFMIAVVALTIAGANAWIIVPTWFLVILWIMSVFGWFIYCHAKGVGEELAKKDKK